MMKNLLLFLMLTQCSLGVVAQNKHAICGTDKHHTNLYSQSPQYKEAYDETKALLAKNRIDNYKTVSTNSGTEYHVPCVVHVLHTGGAIGSSYNPSITTINALITQINNGFANTFNNTSIAGGFNGTNIPIRFYLAQRDETACTPTTGINRVNMSSNGTYVSGGVRRSTNQPGVTDATIKAQGSWNDLNYFNIYIVNKINGEDGFTSTGSYVAGYANYPVLGGISSDGMVCLSYSAGQATSTTFIHEMGHCFNLAHTFNGGSTTACPSNANCASSNDEVCDTEPMLASFSCNPSGNNPCTSAPYAGGQWNYMGYNGCTDRFTAGQITRVMSTLNNVRTSLKNSAGIDPPPTSLPTAITAPAYTTTNNGNNFNMGPRKVVFNAIEHTSNGYSFEGVGYQHYRDNICNQSTTVVAGATYALNVLTSGNPQDCSVYIDYNNDGTFNPTTERILNSNGTGGNQTHNSNVVIPASAASGTPLRMRVIADFSNATITPTGTLIYGQAEDFTVTIIAAPLAVVWRSISANLNTKQNIEVRWSTEIEENSNLFEIEKSKDGNNFYKIGSVNATGQSTRPSHYSFEDMDNVSGYNYYRIKQIDIDGKSTYSSIATEVVKSNELSIVIFPNPTNGYLNINIVGLSINDNEISYVITDINGQIIMQEFMNVNQRNIKFTKDLSQLHKGMYFVQLKVNNEFTIQKIVKQ